MSKLVITMDAGLETLSVDELIALNQNLGRDIDAIREYRKQVKDAYSKKISKAAILAKLTPEEIAEIVGSSSVTITPDPVGVNLGVNE